MPIDFLFRENHIVCRTADLYLTSSIGSGLKQRPQLNLTVRKELKGLGGKIIAQSGMAKVCWSYTHVIHASRSFDNAIFSFSIVYFLNKFIKTFFKICNM